mmetsp:Transcript_24840/g.58965  ORF Transcript_24840/g.58965 Transcript_24840/m.58965 type:complete len:91 (+) Transcript_24840:1575-1847(+)
MLGTSTSETVAEALNGLKRLRRIKEESRSIKVRQVSKVVGSYNLQVFALAGRSDDAMQHRRTPAGLGSSSSSQGGFRTCTTITHDRRQKR